MARFLDIYLPAKVPGYPCVSSPRFKTTIQVSAGGGENSNQEWEHPLHKFVLPEAAGRNWSVIEAIGKHWKIMRGPAPHLPVARSARQGEHRSKDRRRARRPADWRGSRPRTRQSEPATASPTPSSW
jgi:hypothetical protein